MTLRLEKPLSVPMRFTAFLHAIAPDDDGMQTVALSVNRLEIAKWTLQDGRPAELSAMIPASSDPYLPLNIRFHIENPVRPVDRGLNADTRTLGIFLTAYRFDPGS